jgi:hypothetical protein
MGLPRSTYYDAPSRRAEPERNGQMILAALAVFS